MNAGSATSAPSAGRTRALDLAIVAAPRAERVAHPGPYGRTAPTKSLRSLSGVTFTTSPVLGECTICPPPM
jgi:hypothetical protein